MSTLKRNTLISIHMLLAAFIFPAILMFLITGGFYTWGIKGSYQPESHIIPLQQPLAADSQMLKNLVETELNKRSIDFPSGKASLKKGGTSYKLEWTGSRRDVVLEPTADPLNAKLTIKKTTWYRNLVQLHKAKGGQVFKVYAAILAVALFLILLSGFIMAWQVPRYRKQAVIASALGVLVFLITLGLS